LKSLEGSRLKSFCHEHRFFAVLLLHGLVSLTRRKAGRTGMKHGCKDVSTVIKPYRLHDLQAQGIKIRAAW
jgi:hypothetical protein